MEREENRNELEYNDGLGDLLREKEKLEFSWGKTAVVLIIVIVFIFLGLTFLFNVGKNIVTETEQAIPELVTDKSLKENNDSLINILNTSQEDVSEPIVPEIQDSLEPIVESKTESTPSSTSISDLKYKLIVGTFKSKPNALNYVKTLKQKGIDSFVITTETNGTSYYRVQAGAHKTRDAAKKQKLNLSKQEIDSYILTIE